MRCTDFGYLDRITDRGTRHLVRFIGLLVFLGLAACTPRGEITVYPAAAEVGSTRSVFVGTTRGTDPETGEEFGRVRNPTARFARIDVSIPPDRSLGDIVWPRRNGRPDPQTDFLTTRQDIYNGDGEFRADLRRALLRRPRSEREAVVFIHGFNTSFAEGIYRIAQLGHDLDLPGVTVHYSWPSRANPLGYVYDRDSALFARDGLEELLDEVAAAGAERIVIVGHSMGTAIAMETLRQLAIENDRKVRPRIAGVILISPDIDVDVFRAQAKRYGELPQPFYIFVSQKDRALALSARLTGQVDRLGNLASVDEIADLNVTLLDVTAFAKGLGHFAPGDSPGLLRLLSRLSEVDESFSRDQAGRPGLLPGAVLTVQNATEIVLSPVTAIADGGL